MKQLTILGATGSIGTQTLQVVDLHRDKYDIYALSAHSSVDTMITLCHTYNPKVVVMTQPSAAKELQNQISKSISVYSDVRALIDIASAPEVDIVMSAIVGSAGMHSTLSAAQAGKRILLANKESLVLGGHIIMSTAKENGAQIIPVDSEHSAIFQALQGGDSGLEKIQLTASGGPFLHTDISELVHMTPAQACAHPNWSMGAKISIDSATMMNKALEVIEAHYLFGLPAEQIDVVVHPQSIIHSSVYFKDGSVLSQLGTPDMRTAISYALSHPERIFSGADTLDLTQYTLEFYPVDYDKFKSLKLAYLALRTSHAHLAAFNGANEEAVAAFLQEKIGFLDIVRVICEVLEHTLPNALDALEDVLAQDKQSREYANKIISSL